MLAYNLILRAGKTMKLWPANQKENKIPRTQHAGGKIEILLKMK